MTNAETAWLSYTSTLTNSATDLPSASTMRALQSAGRTRSVSLWTLRYLLSETTRILPDLLAKASDPHASPDHIVKHITAAHEEYTRALIRLKHVSTSFAQPTHRSKLTAHPQPSHSFHNLCHRFIHRLRAHLQANCFTPQFSLAIYRFFKARVAKGRPKQIEQYLTDLGFARVTDDALSWAVFERLDALVASHVSSPTVRAVPDLLRWVREFTTSSVSPSSSLTIPNPDSSSSLWKKRLEFHLHESVCENRTEQLLSLIEQFPRSIPALHDLRDCFRCTDRKPFVAQSLRRQFEQALLNAGTQTADIIQRYVSTIRTLRFLDPSGVVLACVSDPIRAYLRRRPDTVRCIVSGMTGDGDLYEELQRGRDVDNNNLQIELSNNASNGVFDTENNGNEDDEDVDCQSIDGDVDIKGHVNVAEYDAWEPEPIDAPAREDGHWRKRGGDAIATLVNIYGSSEQIVAEYRALLSDKLVSQFDVDITREERILSLLTERFGKAAMHDCVIMLKDVRDSRAVLQINEERGKENDREKNNGERTGEQDNGDKLQHVDSDGWFDATVISREFWPRLADEVAFKPPQEIENKMRTFSQAFGRAKKARKLKWLHGLGACRVRLEFDDGRIINAAVSPMQAAALDVFARIGRIALGDLAKQLGIEDLAVLRRKVVALANRGILRAVSSDVYEPVEDGGSGKHPATSSTSPIHGGQKHMNGDGEEIDVDNEDEDDDIYGDNCNEDDDEHDNGVQQEMAVYETYIIAMLTNLKQLSLEQIHTMLKRFVQTPVYDKTQTQLANFLVTLVEKGKVEVATGIYKVKKKARQARQ